MYKGKQTCRILKDIRRQIAEANDIELITSECQYQGDCLGTCPKCEAEVRHLEQQLEFRKMAGKVITIVGLSAGMLTFSACGSSSKITSEKNTSGVVITELSQVDGYTSDSILIKGNVTDENHATLPGVTICEKGTQNGICSDEFGNFTLKVSKPCTLVISFIGLQSKEVKIERNCFVQVALEQEGILMGEVPVVEYKKSKRK